MVRFFLILVMQRNTDHGFLFYEPYLGSARNVVIMDGACSEQMSW